MNKLLIIFVLLFSQCTKEEKQRPGKYTVDVIFCDDRPTKTIQFEYDGFSDPLAIYNYKRAVPEYRDYYNVCEVKLIKKE